MKREVVTIEGRVVGVGFRDRVCEIARRHSVAGNVRNVCDRSLEIDAEGEPDALDRFIDDVLAHPPRAASVSASRRTEKPPRGALDFTRS